MRGSWLCPLPWKLYLPCCLDTCFVASALSFEGHCFKPRFGRASMLWSEVGRTSSTTYLLSMCKLRRCSVLYVTVVDPRWARLVFPSPSSFDQVPWRPFPLAWPCWGPMMPWHLTLVGSLSASYALRLHRAQALYAHPRLPCFFEAATSQLIYIRLLLASVTFNVFLWARFIFPSPSSFDRSLPWPAAGWPDDVVASGSCRLSCLVLLFR